jgi:hypothetical protein
MKNEEKATTKFSDTVSCRRGFKVEGGKRRGRERAIWSRLKGAARPELGSICSCLEANGEVEAQRILE